MDIRRFFFDNRSYTPIPLILGVLILADPSWISFCSGIGVALLGEVIRIWAVSFAGSATRTTSGAGGDTLIMAGPYGYMRNPLYAGNFLMSTGICLAAWPWMPWMLLITIMLFIFQYSLIISLEEEYMSKKFPQLYQQYLSNVPRIIPRLSKFSDDREWSVSISKGIRSERSTIASFVFVTLFIYLRWHFWS